MKVPPPWKSSNKEGDRSEVIWPIRSPLCGCLAWPSAWTHLCSCQRCLSRVVGLVVVCVCERERERERGTYVKVRDIFSLTPWFPLWYLYAWHYTSTPIGEWKWNLSLFQEIWQTDRPTALQTDRSGKREVTLPTKVKPQKKYVMGLIKEFKHILHTLTSCNINKKTEKLNLFIFPKYI